MISENKKRITITIDLEVYERIVKFCHEAIWLTKSQCCNDAISFGLDCMYHEAKGGLVRFD